MGKKESMEVFDIYNREEDVVRCPYGRAGVRKQLDSYAYAAVNLYGVISRRELVDIFNSQNDEKTTEEEMYILLLPLVIKEGWYCFYKEYVVHYEFIGNFEQVENLLSHQADKPRYVPDRDEFLKYIDGRYEDNDHWWNVRRLIGKAFGYSKNNTEGYWEVRNYITHDRGISELGPIMERRGFIFNSEDEFRKFMDLLMLARNNTRIWENNGYTPSELHEILKERNRNIIPFPQEREILKAGRNDPCPCGSGKKYKKCCGLIDEQKTAQLSTEECREFYETWYGLLGFVNEKKNVINAKIKAEYPNEVSDVRIHKVRETLWEEPGLIDEYISETELPKEKIDILKLWKDKHKKAMLVIMKYLPEYAVVLSSDEQGQDRLYGVKGISNSVASVMSRALPAQAETVLLPFKGKIIYDSFFSSMPIEIMGGAKKLFNELYEKAKERGIVISLE